MVIIWWDTHSATSKSKTSTRQLLSGRAWENLSGRAKTFCWTQDQPFGTGLNILADPETASWRRFVPRHLLKFYQSDLLKNLLVSFFWFHPARRACYWVTYFMYFFPVLDMSHPWISRPVRKKKEKVKAYAWNYCTQMIFIIILDLFVAVKRARRVGWGLNR